MVTPFREGLFSRNSASAKFRENNTFAKNSECTVILKPKRAYPGKQSSFPCKHLKKDHNSDGVSLVGP